MKLTKKCCACKEEKELKYFSKCKGHVDSLASNCKSCAREYGKEWRKKDREAKLAKKREYYEENKSWILEQMKTYREENKEIIIERKNRYYEENKDVINEKGKSYKQRRIAEDEESYRKMRAETANKYNCSISKTKRWLRRLPITDCPKMLKGGLSVLCKTCGERFHPTNSQIRSRVLAYEGKIAGESNLYCSEGCKSACPLYKFRPTMDTDPRSNLYIPKNEAQEARACQTDHLKQLQCDEVGYNYCERCGSEGPVHLHHTLLVSVAGQEAINSAGHLLLCSDCHREVHRECSTI